MTNPLKQLFQATVGSVTQNKLWQGLLLIDVVVGLIASLADSEHDIISTFNKGYWDAVVIHVRSNSELKRMSVERVGLSTAVILPLLAWAAAAMFYKFWKAIFGTHSQPRTTRGAVFLMVIVFMAIPFIFAEKPESLNELPSLFLTLGSITLGCVDRYGYCFCV